jgi:HlyD family secretion protein
LHQQTSALLLNSPISGTVLTANLRDRAGTALSAGQELLVVADLSSLRARIYVSEYELSKIQQSARARLQVHGLFGTWEAQTFSISATPTEMDPRLLRQPELKGTIPPHYYLVDLVVANPDGALKPGMAGLARIYGHRRSLAGILLESTTAFFGRKLW